MDDIKLVARARRGKRTALAAIFDRYYRPIYRYVLHYTRHSDVAEDLAAQVFLRLTEALKRDKGPTEHLKAWLFRTAHNLVIDDARRQTHRNHLPLGDLLLHDDDLSPEERASLRLTFERAYAALDRLTDDQRAVVVLRFMNGLNRRETAAVLGTTPTAIKGLQQRALASLRDVLVSPEEMQ
jgi:RNA polymerase sigma-70 factor (ECF subfamily)